MRKENGLVIFECDKDANGKEILNSSQRNNELVWPSEKSKPKAQYRTSWKNMCNVTSMVMGLEYAGYSFPDGKWKQPEDNLAEFILTSKDVLEHWKNKCPAQYDLFVKSLEGKLTAEQVKRDLLFPTEIHTYLSMGVCKWIGTTATYFRTYESFIESLWVNMVEDDLPLVISTTFGGFGHIVCCTGVAYDEKEYEAAKSIESALTCPKCGTAVTANFPTPKGIYVDDPWGKYNPKTNQYDAPNGGNDIFIPWDVVVARVKPCGSTDIKWAHSFRKGIASV